MWEIGDSQDFARAVAGSTDFCAVNGNRDYVELKVIVRPVMRVENRPQPRIFRAEPPQRDSPESLIRDIAAPDSAPSPRRETKLHADVDPR